MLVLGIVVLALVNADERSFEQLIEVGEFTVLLERSEEVLATSPKDLGALRTAGYAAQTLGRFDDARRHFQTALTVDANDLYSLSMLGNIEHTEGNLVAAGDYYRKVLEKSPDDPGAKAELQNVEERIVELREMFESRQSLRQTFWMVVLGGATIAIVLVLWSRRW